MNVDKVVYSRLFLNGEPDQNNLSVVFRKALLEKGINEHELKRRIGAFVTKDTPDFNDQSTAINNIEKELAQSNMSWNVFVKGMKILGVADITILT